MIQIGVLSWGEKSTRTKKQQHFITLFGAKITLQWLVLRCFFVKFRHVYVWCASSNTPRSQILLSSIGISLWSQNGLAVCEPWNELRKASLGSADIFFGHQAVAVWFSMGSLNVSSSCDSWNSWLIQTTFHRSCNCTWGLPHAPHWCGHSDISSFRMFCRTPCKQNLENECSCAPSNFSQKSKLFHKGHKLQVFPPFWVLDFGCGILRYAA